MVGMIDFDCDFAPACLNAALFGAQAMGDQNINEGNKTLQNHHSARSTTADPVQSYATGPIVEIACVPPVCLSNQTVGIFVWVHQSDSKAALA